MNPGSYPKRNGCEPLWISSLCFSCFVFLCDSVASGIKNCLQNIHSYKLTFRKILYKLFEQKYHQWMLVSNWPKYWRLGSHFKAQCSILIFFFSLDPIFLPRLTWHISDISVNVSLPLKASHVTNNILVMGNKNVTFKGKNEWLSSASFHLPNDLLQRLNDSSSYVEHEGQKMKERKSCRKC